MNGCFALLSGLSFVIGFFAFTWARGCLLRGKRMLMERDENAEPGKLELSKLAAIDGRLASQYRIGMMIWLVSGLACIGFALAAICTS